MRILLNLILMWMWLLSSYALAGEEKIIQKSDNYVFIKGKGIEVCEAYYRNLIEYKAEVIACERKFTPGQVDFKKPAWQNLDIAENKDLAIKIYKFIETGDQFKVSPDLDKAKNYIKSSAYFLNAQMYYAKIDIDNDGRLDHVILYDSGGCEHTAHVYWKPPVILDDKMELVNVKKTASLLPEPIIGDKKKIEDRGAILTYQIYDVFYYKDKVYYDRWSLAGANKIYVNQLRGLNNSVVCIYKIK